MTVDGANSGCRLHFLAAARFGKYSQRSFNTPARTSGAFLTICIQGGGYLIMLMFIVITIRVFRRACFMSSDVYKMRGSQ